MPLYAEVVAALKEAGITPENLFYEDWSAEQATQVQAAFPHHPISLLRADWEVGRSETSNMFCFEGHDQEVWIRVSKYTGGGGGEFDEATFEHVRPVQTTTYERYPAPTVGAVPPLPMPR